MQLLHKINSFFCKLGHKTREYANFCERSNGMKHWRGSNFANSVLLATIFGLFLLTNKEIKLSLKWIIFHYSKQQMNSFHIKISHIRHTSKLVVNIGIEIENKETSVMRFRHVAISAPNGHLNFKTGIRAQRQMAIYIELWLVLFIKQVKVCRYIVSFGQL